jgi:aspartate dehydrogenase
VKVGVIGCGAIGLEVVRACVAMEGIESMHAFDIDDHALAAAAHAGALRCSSADEVVAACDTLVEAATKDVVATAVRDALVAGKRAVLLTVGALADDALRADLVALARAHGGKLHVPTGAIVGLDGVRAAREAGLTSVTLVTTKPNAGLDRKVDRWTILFNGTAREAVAEYPKNVNVAAALSLAGLGFDETWVQVVADPLATHNSHKIIVEGAFGRARIEVENLPSPQNPRTSHLAALSTIALLRRIVSPIEIGS